MQQNLRANAQSPTDSGMISGRRSVIFKEGPILAPSFTLSQTQGSKGMNFLLYCSNILHS